MPATLTPGDGQDLLARYKRAWETRDPDLAVDVFAEDAEFRPDPFEPPLIGANAIRAHWNRVAAEQANVEFDAERVWVSGRTVLSSWHGAYTVRSSARRIRARGFLAMELADDGAVARLRAWTISRDIGIDHGFDGIGSTVGIGSGQDG